VQTVPQLYKAAREGRIRDVPGFGEKTETHILEATEAHLSKARRFKLAVGAQYADAIVAYLRAVPGVRIASPPAACGGCARRSATSTSSSRRHREPGAQRFVAYPR